jgi:hypothetical protein
MAHTAQRRAPRHLKIATRRWWEAVVATWELEEHHTRLLTATAEAWDTMQEAGRDPAPRRAHRGHKSRRTTGASRGAHPGRCASPILSWPSRIGSRPAAASRGEATTCTSFDRWEPMTMPRKIRVPKMRSRRLTLADLDLVAEL